MPFNLEKTEQKLGAHRTAITEICEAIRKHEVDTVQADDIKRDIERRLTRAVRELNHVLTVLEEIA
jgi:hypothetical protein